MPQDSFRSRAKMVIREADLQWAFRQPWLFEEDKIHMRLAWCELAGDSVGLTVELLKQHGVVGRFVGVDLEIKHIQKHQLHYPGSEYEWICGNLFSVLHTDSFNDVGLFHIDGYYEINSPLLVENLPSLKSRIARNVAANHGCAVLINFVLDTAKHRRRQKLSTALRKCVESITDGLDGWQPRVSMNPDYLAPEDECELVDDAKFVGLLGQFEVYRGTGTRMATLRMAFR